MNHHGWMEIREQGATEITGRKKHAIQLAPNENTSRRLQTISKSSLDTTASTLTVMVAQNIDNGHTTDHKLCLPKRILWKVNTS